MKKEVEKIEKVFKALGYEKRLRILNYVIANSGRTVSEISDGLRLPFATVSRNLIVLADAGLVKGHSKNNLVMYAADIGGLFQHNIVLLSMVKQAFEKDIKGTKRNKSGLTGLMFGDYGVLKTYINV